MNKLTPEEKITNYETLLHIQKVQHYLNNFAKGLIERGEKHDQSKLTSPEVELFSKYTEHLSSLTYGSEEYNESLKKLKPALDHHYANNSHHPEFHKNSIDDMNLLDIVEMFCDWKAASLRHNDGNINKSIEKNAVRFNMSSQLVKIFENSVDLLM